MERELFKNKPIRQAYDNFVFNLISNLRPNSGLPFLTLTDFVRSEYRAFKGEPEEIQARGLERYISEKYKSFNN